MTPLTAVILTVLVGLTIGAKRRTALLAIVVGTLFLTQGQYLTVAGFSLAPMRILAWVGFVRVVSRGEFSFRNLNKIDWALTVLYVFMTLILLTRDEEAVPLRIAKLLDVLCCYFAARGLVADTSDFRWLLKTLPFLLVPYVLLLAIEFTTHRSAFVLVGGNSVPWVREGKLRCFGSFRHPSLLGSVGATFFPLFIGLYWSKEYRKHAIIGAATCVAIVLFSNSGGPLSAWATGVVGWCVWLVRTKMRAFRIGLVVTIAVLAMVMKAPIWYLIAKVSSITGGTGWHRSYLIDVAVRHLDKWWLAGMPLKETAGWFPYNLAATGGADITNQFIAYGLNAGLVAIALSFVLLTLTFKSLGQNLSTARFLRNERDERLLWGLGVMQVVHISNWLGITYWDQFFVFWLIQLAAISGITLAAQPRPRPEPARISMVRAAS